jgi:transposase-like protein
LRQVEDLLHERGIDICHETVRAWWNRFGQVFAAEIRRKWSASMRSFPQWRWHLDEVYVRINEKLHYLWRAEDHEGEVLNVFVTKKRDRKAALRFLKNNEAIRLSNSDCYGSSSLLLRCHERDRQCGATGNRSLAEQSRSKFTSTFSATRASDVEIQERKVAAEIRRYSCFRPQSF